MAHLSPSAVLAQLAEQVRPEMTPRPFVGDRCHSVYILHDIRSDPAGHVVEIFPFAQPLSGARLV